jgi:WS/DGAT/MGAT family acyltransferase
MRPTRQLLPQDVLFVGGERPNVYYHVSGLTMLDATDRPDFGFEAVRDRLIAGLEHVPHFRWRLHEVPFGLDLPYWVEDEGFSFDHHIRRIAVPSPGDRRALGEVVSHLYSRHLDRTRPLWEAWFIDGLADGQYGLFTKLHHCMMDGQAAAKLAEILADADPDASSPPIDPAIAAARPGEVPELWRQSLTAARHLSALPVRATREIVGAAAHTFRRLLASPLHALERPRAPSTSFNRDVGAQRGYVFGALPLADVKDVKNHFGVTVNDVVLAVVAGSLRHYLIQRGELPDEPLRTSIAVSLRTDADDTFSNQVTSAGVSLATDVGDPAARLQAIAADSRRAKARARSGGKSLFEVLSMLPPALVGTVLSLTPAGLVREVSGYNLIVSSVRGSPLPLRMGGARVTAMYPMSIIQTGGGINVTCMSYVDDIDVGMTIEPTQFPDAWCLVDGLREALDAYRAVVPGAGRHGAGRHGQRPREGLRYSSGPMS